MPPIPVIDLFAGPGGLGEGFSAVRDKQGKPAFKIHLSVEKDPHAHQTLELRSFFRQFPSGDAPDQYYQFVKGDITRDSLFEAFPKEASHAKSEAWLEELRPESALRIRDAIDDLIGTNDGWVLIGGPPCQAYSLAGRSRNGGIKGYDPSKDRRQTLYLEYLQILADHAPPVFVMENVKGLLSAKFESRDLFDRILQDLTTPAEALRREGRSIRHGAPKAVYTVHSLVVPDQAPLPYFANEFVVRSEDFGIPQARHRIIFLGVRHDLARAPGQLVKSVAPTTGQVLRGLPRLRSGLSGRYDSRERWARLLRRVPSASWLKRMKTEGDRDVCDRILIAIDHLSQPHNDRGKEFIPYHPRAAIYPQWYLDPRLEGVANHFARGHMTRDLYRYLFAASFGKEKWRSPALAEFPRDLRPKHKNVNLALRGSFFADRFRVQIATRPSTTVTSHISKDGHYYIHYDPTQCRSLTVREAARLQTFPDNYLFCGGRTSQYVQVGNAVPPLLARQIASLVHRLLD